MKRICSLLCALLLCLSVSSVHSEFSREDWYGMGLAALQKIDPDRLEDAMSYSDAAGNYQEAKSFKQYIQSLQDIFAMDEGKSVDLEITSYRLQVLAKKPEFEAALLEYALPSCAGLDIYLLARQMEESGSYAIAWHLYAEIDNVLDALDRRIDLTPQAYEQGKRAYQRGNYAEAADALRDLDFKDSGEMFQYADAIANPTPALAPRLTPTPQRASPTPTLEPRNTWPVGARCTVVVGSGPGTDYPKVGEVFSGERYYIQEYRLGSTGKDWYRINLEGITAWISSALVEIDGHTGGTVNGIPLY